jgi:choline dehydrogenase-like flavoprotein
VQINATGLSMRATLDAEVAIVGAGPAGITLALELADAGHRVVLIESGGTSYDAEVQRLGDTSGHDTAHAPMSLATRRQIGGASNLWAGRCVPFDPVDFDERELVEGVSWPVGFTELASYFQRACSWCKCGTPAFDARQIPNLAGKELIPGWPEGDIRSTMLERWSLPTNFARVYGARLRDSTRVTLVSDLTCTEIVCAPAGTSVDHLAARTLSGNEVQIRARRYVLACGGIESTRLLFASDRVHPDGIGNHSGHLGHWYMSHVGASIVQARFSTPPRATIHGFERDPGGIYVRRRFTFSQEYLIEHNLPNVALWLENPDIGDPAHGSAVLSSIYLALASPLGRYFLSEGIRRRKLETGSPGSTWLHIRNVMRRAPLAAWFALTFGYKRFLQPGHKVPGIFVPSATNTYKLYYHGEHIPHYDSCVLPTGERDALGMPRMQTRLRFTQQDVHGALRVHEHFDAYLRRAGLGRIEYLFDDPRAAFQAQLFDGYHQAGTTRMSAHAADGVVDARLAVHGFDDLFVASSSVFATSGQANSTFMIIVFALRLADHLRRTLRAASTSAKDNGNGATADVGRRGLRTELETGDRARRAARADPRPALHGVRDDRARASKHVVGFE